MANGSVRRAAGWLAGVAIGLAAAPALAQENDVLSVDPALRRPSALAVKLPEMDAARGRILFATKGCVICHEVNGVGGRRGKAPSLDAARMALEPNPFEFAARMWRGATDMIALQKEDLGYQIEIRADELADIFAFVHDADEQRLFTLPGRTAQ